MELIVSNKKREIEKIAGKPEDYDENLKSGMGDWQKCKEVFRKFG